MTPKRRALLSPPRARNPRAWQGRRPLGPRCDEVAGWLILCAASYLILLFSIVALRGAP